VISTPLLDRLIYALGAEKLVVRNFLEQFAKSERVSQEMVEAYVGTTAKCRIRGAGIFCGDLYFDLALYIQQLAVPTIMLCWGTIYQRQSGTLAQLNPQAVRAFDPIAGVGVPHLEMPEVVIGLQQYFRSLLPSRR